MSSDPTRARIVAVDAMDVRFPTSESLDGSDAMNKDPDYSAAYVTLRTDDAAGPQGQALVFTTGRGNDVQTRAIAALAPYVVGRTVDEICDDLGGFSRDLVNDPQLRWLGPEKGVMHMAIGGVINAAWDLAAKRANQPVWLFLASMTPEQLVDLVDFRYLSDALTRDEALDILRRAEPGRSARIGELLDSGYPAYTTSPGWLGYSDEKMVRLAKEAVAEGFTQIKLKVGGDIADDVRRISLVRETLGEQIRIALDANQKWDVAEAIEAMRAVAPYNPYWIEEPTSPDDILAHAVIRRAIHPIKVATGEHVANRVVFKQLLQAGSVDVIQIDSARVGGINENLANLLLAAKFQVPVCPHAGGVGLCEMVQHLSMFDFVAVSGTMDGRAIEFVDHLHEHFVNPVVIENGRYLAPRAPGLAADILSDTLKAYLYPTGHVWSERA
ncbi:enolase C-terminal domain-like protein [Leekyejoonella antrihumi]|uniref:L-fuconate dehydratase n=1 Tax=Leekyejoonella antrihumi TaxID=1660198 RepID=A0A563DV53_9MICO|nr:enolase C-terminal domain-like protein [Leekyejoonella antrihumi]TWP34128.1 fuconate dehydratase [Leekyejoonella antrihumi]